MITWIPILHYFLPSAYFAFHFVDSSGVNFEIFPFSSVYIVLQGWLLALLCVCVKLLQLCLALCNPTDYHLPSSSVHGILQARILEWVAISSSKGTSRPGIKPASLISPALTVELFTTSATWEALVLLSVQFSSVTQSCLTLWYHEPQHASLPCPSPTPGVHPNPCPLSRWCYPTISSSVVPFSFCPQSFPVSGSFQMSQLVESGGQSIGLSASTSVLPVNTQDWSLLDGLVGSPCSPRDSQKSSPTPQFKSINSFMLSLLHSPTLTAIHDHRKNHSLNYEPLLAK